ncbi:MAG: TetR/AcrR family transcriptional regulator [Deltaproteobacteria bacterium]|nr:MAG: TetR/AcrR family transcriptional regulator [Deltaproteobacteria bacterium]
MKSRSDRSAATRERILQAAKHLFAKQGYAATGMRQIAGRAGVSLAMINYHFGSKQKLLLELLDSFFSGIERLAKVNLAGTEPPEEKIRRHIKTMCEMLERETELLQVALLELPRDQPEVLEFKAERMRRVAGLFARHLLPVVNMRRGRPLRLEVAGPAIGAMVFSHFLLRPLVERVFDGRFNKEFYAALPEQLAELALGGLLGVQANRKEGQDGTVRRSDG